MKLKFYLPVFIFGIFFSSVTAQINVDEKIEVKESTTQGFFVKNGQQKISALDCYSFDDLILSFDLREEHFTCDQIRIDLIVGDKESKYEYSYFIDGDNLKDLVKRDDYAFVKVFSSKDLTEKSVWENPTTKHLRRSHLQYTNSKSNLDDSKLSVKIYTRKKTRLIPKGTSTPDGSFYNSDIQLWTEWTSPIEFSIGLKNRIFIKYATFFIKGFPKEPVVTENCFN